MNLSHLVVAVILIALPGSPRWSAAQTESTPEISLHMENAPLRDALQSVAEQGQLKLIYADDLMKNVRISIQFDRLPVEQALRRLLDRTPLTFRRLKDNHIVLMQRTRQSVIIGRVSDRDTGEPLEGASVFLASTTVGTLTDESGDYRIRNVPQGAYNLIVSHIGYDLQATTPVHILHSDTLRYDSRLMPHVIDVQPMEVTASRSGIERVAPDTGAWRKNLKKFIEEFIGVSRFAKECRLGNPEALSFDYDTSSGVFQAHADSAIYIDNLALGYRLYVVMESFRTTDHSIEYTVYPRFERMEPRNNADLNKWQTNRRQAYQGSLRHFLIALIHDRLDKEQFAVWTTRDLSPKVQVSRFYDHLVDYRFFSSATVKDMMGRHFDPHTVIFSDESGLQRIQFQDYLLIRNGLNYSSIKLNTSYALIDTLGNLHTPPAFTKFGAWWKDRIGDLLPEDYQPDY